MHGRAQECTAAEFIVWGGLGATVAANSSPLPWVKFVWMWGCCCCLWGRMQAGAVGAAGRLWGWYSCTCSRPLPRHQYHQCWFVCAPGPTLHSRQPPGLAWVAVLIDCDYDWQLTSFYYAASCILRSTLICSVAHFVVSIFPVGLLFVGKQTENRETIRTWLDILSDVVCLQFQAFVEVFCCALIT